MNNEKRLPSQAILDALDWMDSGTQVESERWFILGMKMAQSIAEEAERGWSDED